MEKIKFVMTDTDTQVSDACRRALEGKGVSVTVCEKNGTKALDALLTIHPQAVLLDAFMPDLDAITVKQRYEAQNAGGSRSCSGTARASGWSGQSLTASFSVHSSGVLAVHRRLKRAKSA